MNKNFDHYLLDDHSFPMNLGENIQTQIPLRTKFGDF